MKFFIISRLVPIVILFALFTLPACKAKKLAQKPTPPVEAAKVAPVVETPKAKPVVQAQPAIIAKKPEFNVNNVKIQFEFDSGVLRTDSYPVLDQVASEIKLHPSTKYILNGYASIEGTKEHNMALSEDRATAVKTYLVNEGVSAANIAAKGYGTSNPVADNNTDAGRVLNRRVEIKKQD